MGSGGASRPRLFVVQKHDARRLHYDFRLEWRGTLWSWAVPKGPSPDPAVKRMAVHVEDHPVEYADFEGKIPKGNYGAGAVIVWDTGLWIPLDDPDRALEAGKLHFLLQGYKLRGEWILVRLKKGGPKDWLLMKKADAHARPGEEAPYPETSILSGLTVKEMRDGSKQAAALRKTLASVGAPRRKLDPMRLPLMLAETAKAPFSGPDWIFELKYDGYRVLAVRDTGGTARLRSRNGHDLTATYPEIARVMRALPYGRVVLDGELVVLDDAGRPSFARLQKRSQLRRKLDIERATIGLPAAMFAFDLLEFEGYDLRSLPLVERKALLRRVVPAAGAIRFADHVAEHGEAMLEGVRKMGLEGIMAKKAAAPYRGGRSPAWLKLPIEKTGDFVVCGYTEPEGTRTGFGALHLGIHEDGKLVYAGRVGTGFTDAQLRDFAAALAAHRRKTPPCRGATLPKGEKHAWVRPEWVVEVRYKTVTEDGLLRHPSFLRVRDDKDPADCTREPVVAPPPAGRAAFEGPDEEPAAEPEAPAEHRIQLSNLKKVFWPGEKITKGDLIDYYRTVAPWILPYLRDRPMVLTRYPDGIAGKSFYQKNAPDFIPGWVRTESIYSNSSEREIKYLVCDDLDMLIYIVNSGAIPLHLWSSRVATIQNPDWCILDLDPKGAPFAHVVTLAKAIHKLCETIGLPNYVKTSGSTGLHVLIPLGRQVTYEQSRTLGHLIARVIEAGHREIATTARVIRARKGKVYLDFLQNRRGQLLAAPYCVRPLPGAPVSAPLEWREVNAKLDPQQFTLRNMPGRLKRKKKDPVLAVLTDKPDLLGALTRLGEMAE